MPTLKRISAAIACAIAVFAAAAADPIEGDWQLQGDGAASLRFQARPGSAGVIDILWLDGPAMHIAPLTPIGTAVAGAEPGLYDCRLAQSLEKGTDGSKFTSAAIRLAGPDNLSIETYHRHARVALWRLIPYLFRRGVIKDSDRPSNLDAARRIGAPPSFIVI